MIGSHIHLYDLLEDRHIVAISITNIFLLFFKMAESFEKSDNILCNWERKKKKKVGKSLVKAVNWYEKQK